MAADRSEHDSIVNKDIKTVDAPFIDRQIAEAAFLAAVMDYLDSNRIDDAKYLLILRQDGNLLAINESLPLADERSRKTAARLFAKIAKHRAGKAFSYKGDLPRPGSNAVAEVNSILEKYR